VTCPDDVQEYDATMLMQTSTASDLPFRVLIDQVGHAHFYRVMFRFSRDECHSPPGCCVCVCVCVC